MWDPTYSWLLPPQSHTLLIQTFQKHNQQSFNSHSREFKMIKFPRSMLVDIKNVRWQSNQGRRARAALRRLLNAPELPICLSSLGRPFHVWMWRTGTVRRVASSLHRRVFSTESEDARVVRSDTSARYSMRDLRLSGASAWLISLWMRTQSLCWMIASNDNQLSCWRASVIWSYFRFFGHHTRCKIQNFLDSLAQETRGGSPGWQTVRDMG